MLQLDKFTYFTQLVQKSSLIFSCAILFVSIRIMMMEGSSSFGKRKASSSSALAGFCGSDDDDDPHKRRKLPIKNECNDATINRIRILILDIVESTKNETLRKNFNNKSTRVWNQAIQTALDERFGYSRWHFGRIAHPLIVTVELQKKGDQSPFFLRVLSLVKGD